MINCNKLPLEGARRVLQFEAAPRSKRGIAEKTKLPGEGVKRISNEKWCC